MNPSKQRNSQKSNNRDPGRKTLDILKEIAESIDFFCDPNGNCYADIRVKSHRETWPIKSDELKNYFMHQLYMRTGTGTSQEVWNSALIFIESRAKNNSPERSVHMRVGKLNGKHYVDLCNKTWQVIEYDDNGWRVIDNPPIRFLRPASARPLPTPVEGGSIDELRKFFNLKHKDDFILLVAWLWSAFRPDGPYPILVLTGEHGSAKSTASMWLRLLVDPNAAPLRSLINNERNLFIAANHSHVLTFDNISKIPKPTSDMMCRLSTGGGTSYRRLYSDRGEVVFSAARPMIVNGIGQIVTQPDLADRSLFLTLAPIPDNRRRMNAEIMKEFEEAHPRLLGALLKGLVEGLRRLPNIRLEALPRMADFAVFSAACETAFWPSGTFMTAYNENAKEAALDAIEADPVAAAVRAMMENPRERTKRTKRTKRTQPIQWEGTATELAVELKNFLPSHTSGEKKEPLNPRSLSEHLKIVLPVLRKYGIDIDFNRKTSRDRTRLINIFYTDLQSKNTQSPPETE